MKKIITLIIGSFLTLSASAQVYSLPGTYSWSSPSAWNGGIPPLATDSVVIIGGSTVILDMAVAHNASITIENGGSLESNVQQYDLTINSGSLTLVGPSSAVDFIDIAAAVPITIINGHLKNAGIFASGHLSISFPTVPFNVTFSENNGDFYVLGEFRIVDSEKFVNNMDVTVISLMDMQNSTEFINNQTISIGVLENRGTISNTGEISIVDSLKNYLSGFITGAGTSIVVANNLINHGTITLSDSLAVNGNLINTGLITNNGGVVNTINDFHNMGSISGSVVGQYYIGNLSENTSSGMINGLIDVCDLSLLPGNYLDIDNGTANIDFNSVTFCGISYASLNELSQNTITIFPNPTLNETIKISFKGKIEHIEVCDLTGRNIDIPIDIVSGSIDASSLQTGKYLIKISNDKTSIIKDFIKL